MANLSNDDINTFINALTKECQKTKSCIVNFSRAVIACNGDTNKALRCLEHLVRGKRFSNPIDATVQSETKVIIGWLKPDFEVSTSGTYYGAPEVTEVLVQDILMKSLEKVRDIADVRRYLALTPDIVRWMVSDWESVDSLIFAINHLSSNGGLHHVTKVAADTADPQLQIFKFTTRPAQLSDLTGTERTTLTTETKKFSAALETCFYGSERTMLDMSKPTHRPNLSLIDQKTPEEKEVEARVKFCALNGH